MEVKKKTFKAWITYQAIQAHFTREYDYFKYNGKLNMNEHSMDKHFAKHEIGGNFSAQRTIFSNLGKVFDSDLYDEYKERMNNFHFHLKRDTEEIMKYMDEYDKTFDEMFIAKGINHPPIMKLGLSKTISLETFTTLDIMLDFLTAMEKKLIDPASKDFIKLVRNYKPFLSISVDKEKKIIMDVLNKG